VVVLQKRVVFLGCRVGRIKSSPPRPRSQNTSPNAVSKGQRVREISAPAPSWFGPMRKTVS
jgi:hypothetical protein